MEKLCIEKVMLHVSFVTLQGVDHLTSEVGKGSGGDFEKYILLTHKKHSCTLRKPKQSVLRLLVTLRINHTN